MGSSSEIEALYYDYKQDVFNFLLYFLKTSDVEDVFQETFIHAQQALDQQVELTNPRSWLIAIARNTAVDHLRKLERDNRKLKRLQTQAVEVDVSSVEEKIQLDERQRVLLRGVYHLKRSYQDVIILRGLKELSVAETSEILGWSENKVTVTYHRALKKLRKILGEGGNGLDK